MFAMRHYTTRTEEQSATFTIFTAGDSARNRYSCMMGRKSTALSTCEILSLRLFLRWQRFGKQI